MSAKLSPLAIADIRMKRLSLREYAKLYGVHNTTVLRVQSKRVTSGHTAEYYRAYYPKREERCRVENGEARRRRYWALWLLRELETLETSGVSTWGISTFDPGWQLNVAIARAGAGRKTTRHDEQTGDRVLTVPWPAKKRRGGGVVCVRGDQTAPGRQNFSDDRLLRHAG